MDVFSPVFVEFAGYDGEMLIDGKPFEAFTSGNFIDMRQNKVTISANDLQKIVDNTNRRIEMTRTSDGTVVGLPIDLMNHEHGDAAGWIVKAELKGNVIRLIPRWTELGFSKLKKSIQRLFSASLDLLSMTIVGGTLTNWPAVSGLKPIELSQAPGFFQMQPKDEQTPALADVESTPTETVTTISEQPADTVTLIQANAQPEVTHFIQENVMSNNPSPEPTTITLTEVQRLILENNNAMFDKFASTLEAKFAHLTAPTPTAVPAPAPTEGTPPVLPKPELSTLVDLSQVEQYKKDLAEQAQDMVKAEFAKMRHNANASLRKYMSDLQEQQRIAEFSRQLTDGSRSSFGIAMPSERIEQILMDLPETSRAKVENLLGEIVKTGLVDFQEIGNAKRIRMLKSLPSVFADSLDKGEYTLAEFKSSEYLKPMLVEYGVTNLADYDLSKWEKK